MHTHWPSMEDTRIFDQQLAAGQSYTFKTMLSWWIHPPIDPSIHPSVHPSICPSISPCATQSLVHHNTYLSHAYTQARAISTKSALSEMSDIRPWLLSLQTARHNSRSSLDFSTRKSFIRGNDDPGRCRSVRSRNGRANLLNMLTNSFVFVMDYKKPMTLQEVQLRQSVGKPNVHYCRGWWVSLSE